MIKKLLHTKAGAYLGFKLGVRGYNRVEAIFNGKSSYSYNARVNKGADLMASLFSGTSLNSITSPLPPKYIALSTSVLTPAAGDTTLSGETAVSGLARSVGTIGGYTGPVSLDGGASYTITKTFTAGVTGPTVIQSTGLFDAASTGNLCAEANLSSSYSLGNGDTLQIVWTVNL